MLGSDWLAGKIMHYSRATLAACRVESHVDYMRIDEMLKLQMASLVSKVKSVMGAPVKREGRLDLKEEEKTLEALAA